MKISTKVTLTIVLLFSFVTLSAQESENIPDEISSYQIRYLGDQMFSLGLGLFTPLFFMNPNEIDSNDFISPTNLSLGAAGALNYGAYISPNWQLGLEIGMSFCYSPNKNMLTMVPLVFKASYEWTPVPYLTIPFYMGAGVSFDSYLENFRVDPLVKPGFGIFWNYSTELSFGVTTHYWWVPQFSDSNSPQYTRFGNFADIRLVAEYHF